MFGNGLNSLARTDKWDVVRTCFYEAQSASQKFSSSHAENIERHFGDFSEWSYLRNFFFERLCAAEFHWFFVQGIDALMNGLYVPAVSSLLNGIEASLRVTIDQVNNPTDVLVNLSPYKVLSNNLIMKAGEIGMPVHCLAFPNEIDFNQKLESQKPSRIDVEIVRQRNNVCHGNIMEFINKDLGEENYFFTPELLKNLSLELLDVSGNWAEQLGFYRKSKNFIHYDA